MREILNGLLQDLARVIGLSDLTLDEANCIGFRFDDRVSVTIRLNPDWPQVELFADVGELPVDAAERRTRMLGLLRANAFWRETGGATLSVRLDERTILLATHTPLAQLDGLMFRNWLEAFVHTAEIWIERLAVADFEIAPVASVASEPAIPAYFIRV